MSEKDPLLLAEGGALIEGAARRSGSSAAATQSSGLCCCKPTAITYLHVSESADEAAGALIAELSIMPREWSDEGGRDARVVDALQRIWSAIASETPDTLRMAPPRIPSREWRKIGFQVRHELRLHCWRAANAELPYRIYLAALRSRRQYLLCSAAQSHSASSPSLACRMVLSSLASHLHLLLPLASVVAPLAPLPLLPLQGDDPYTDMRGAGLSGFTYIARLAEEYAGEWQWLEMIVMMLRRGIAVQLFTAASNAHAPPSLHLHLRLPACLSLLRPLLPPLVPFAHVSLCPSPLPPCLPAEARMIGAAPDSELPFGIGALNVLWMLRCHLMLFEEPPAFCPCCGSGIRGEYAGRQPHRGRHIRGFAMLMLDDRDAWMHLFALSFLVTAALWRKRGEAIALAAAAAAAAARRATGSGSGSTAPASVRSSLTGTMMAAGAGGSAGGGGKASMAESAASGASGATSASATQAQAQARHKRISAAKIAPLSNSSASPPPSGGAGMMALPGSISRDAAGSGSSHGILPVPGAGASVHGASNGSLPTASADGHGAALLHGHNSTPGGGSGSGASRTGSVSVLTASVGPGGASSLGGVGGGVTSVSIAGAASAASATAAGSAATTTGGSLGSGAVVAVGDARLLEFNSILREAREVVLEALATFPPDLTTLRLALFKRLRAKGLGGGAGGGAAVSGGVAVAAGPAAAAAVAAAHAAHAAHAPSAASLSMSLSVPMLISHPSAAGPLAFEPLPTQLTGAGKGDAPTTDDGAFGAGFAGDSSRSGGGASAAMPVALPVPMAGGGTGPRRSSRHVSGHAAGQANGGLLSSEALQASLRTTSGSSGGALTAAAAAGTSYAASTPPFGASPAAGFGSYMAGPGEAGHVHSHAHSQSHGHPHSHGHGHAAHAINSGAVPGGASSSSLQFGGSVAALWGSQMMSPDAAAAGAAFGGSAAAPPAGSGHR